MKNNMTKKNLKFQQIQAFCNGKAYGFPTDFHVSKSRNGYYYLDIYTGSVYLAKFILSNKKELYKAVDIVTKSLKHNVVR